MIQEINRRLHEALGYKVTFRHANCGHGVMKANVPDYCADPRLVIEAIDERGELDKFLRYMAQHGGWLTYIMDTTGKLALLALEWLGKQGGGER